MKARAIALSMLLAFAFILALFNLPWGVNRSSSLAYPAPFQPDSSTPNAYPPPGSGAFAPLSFAYPAPQINPTITVTVEPQSRLPIVVGPTYSPKKGLGLGAAHLYPDDYARLNVSWIYNWDLEPSKFDDSSPLHSYHASDLLPGNVEFVPMIYCGNEVEKAKNYLGVDWDGYLLFLNEPWVRPEDDCGRLTTQEVAEAYVDIRLAFPQAKLIGPNIHDNSFDPADPPGRLAEWRETVKTLTGTYPDVTGYAIHTYTGDPLENRSYVERLHIDLLSWQQQEGRIEPYELWVTEFGYCGEFGNPSDDLAAQDITETVNDLEILSYVNRYAYYANRTHPKRINQSNDCFINESENYFLLVELYGDDPVDPDNPKDVCRRIEKDHGITDCNDLTYTIFEGYIDWVTHFTLTHKGIAYRQAGVLR